MEELNCMVVWEQETIQEVLLHRTQLGVENQSLLLSSSFILNHSPETILKLGVHCGYYLGH